MSSEGIAACDVASGQCVCKSNAVRRACDACAFGYFNLSAANPSGCTACGCSALGTAADSVCDAGSGQCVSGFYEDDTGMCVSCGCNASGTVGAIDMCAAIGGQCACKQNIGGQSCDQCASGTYGLTLFSDGCHTCDCSASGTQANTTCDPISGQCACAPLSDGRQCDACVDGAYLSTASASSNSQPRALRAAAIRSARTRARLARRAVRRVERPMILSVGLHGRPVPQLQRGLLPLELVRHVCALQLLRVGPLSDGRLQLGHWRMSASWASPAHSATPVLPRATEQTTGKTISAALIISSKINISSQFQ